MKNVYFILIFSVCSIFNGIGQTTNFEFTTTETVYGENYENATSINGIEYTFQNHVRSLYTDSISKLLTLQLMLPFDDHKWLTDDGAVAVFDLKNNKILWGTGVNFQGGSFDQVNSVIIKTTPYDGRFVLNKTNGNTLWETKKVIYYTDPVKMIGLSYNTAKQSDDNLMALDLTTGKTIWTRSLSQNNNGSNGWIETAVVNDSTIIVVSNGVHTINLNNGSGWDVDLITKDKSNTTIASNIVQHNSNFYIASKDKLVCINNAGKLIWSTPLPTETSSLSNLFIKNNNIFLVNLGYIESNGAYINYGKPYFASFNLSNGTPNFNSPIASPSYIKGMDVKNEYVAFLFNSEIKKYSLSHGKILQSVNFDANTNGTLRYALGDHRYPARQKIFTESKEATFINLVLSDTSKHFILTSKYEIIVLDKNLTIVETIKQNKIYYNINNIYDKKLLSSMMAGDAAYKTILINKENKSIAVINASYDAKILDGYLYDCKGFKLFKIDLRAFNGK